mgnify:CR=1 FL=1
MSRIDRSNENSETHEIYKRQHKNPEISEISKILRLLFIYPLLFKSQNYVVLVVLVLNW